MKKTIDIFRALADETRLRIYLLLTKQEMCVCELVSILKMEQSRISHSLRILKDTGLLCKYRQEKWIIYSTSPELQKDKIIQTVKDKLKLSKSDMQNLAKCKRENVRQKQGGCRWKEK